MSLRFARGTTLSLAEEVSFLLPALPTAARWARRQITATLSAWQVPLETLQCAELVVSELVTNSIKIADSGKQACSAFEAPQISLTLRLLLDRLVIEVLDNDPNPPVLAEAGADEENGRGLML